ncbi:MAG: hypothetical protein J0M02_04625 [Planctomycetes bacterium]|nr:hypothetical protein [Planctomycetota bacterium]
MSDTTRYLFGRGLAHALIIIGWIVAGLVVVAATFAMTMGKEGIPPILRALIGLLIGSVAGGVIGAVNHGVWQALLALFDIADHTQQQTDILQRLDYRSDQHDRPAVRNRVVTSAPTPGEVWAAPVEPTPPRPSPAPFVPAGKRAGETDEQWARRIEREEVEAFKQKRGANEI